MVMVMLKGEPKKPLKETWNVVFNTYFSYHAQLCLAGVDEPLQICQPFLKALQKVINNSNFILQSLEASRVRFLTSLENFLESRKPFLKLWESLEGEESGPRTSDVRGSVFVSSVLDAYFRVDKGH